MLEWLMVSKNGCILGSAYTYGGREEGKEGTYYDMAKTSIHEKKKNWLSSSKFLLIFG
jgi:hypothetical protein